MDNLSFLENSRLKGEVSVLGIPLDLGKDAVGTDGGANELREHGLIKILQETGLEVKDLGDIKCPDRTMAEVGEAKAKYLEPIAAVAEKTAAAIYDEVKAGKKVIALGGDNTISLGSLSGASAALDGELGVIWIDAHGDINTVETSLSGNVHGMPIAAMLGLGHPKLTNIFKTGQKIKPENLVFVGLKDLDQAEIDLIRKLNINSVTMLQIAEKGLQPAFEAIKELQKKVKNIWVCLDIDSMDEECAPGTPMATKGGLSYRESVSLAKFIGKTCEVVGIDVSELSPALDKENRTAKLVIELITNYFGAESNWYTRYMHEEMKKQAVRLES